MAERLFGRSSHGLEANLTRFGDAGQSSIEKTLSADTWSALTDPMLPRLPRAPFLPFPRPGVSGSSPVAVVSGRGVQSSWRRRKSADMGSRDGSPSFSAGDDFARESAAALPSTACWTTTLGGCVKGDLFGFVSTLSFSPRLWAIAELAPTDEEGEISWLVAGDMREGEAGEAKADEDDTALPC